MNRLLTLFLGGTAGAASSEARGAFALFVAGVLQMLLAHDYVGGIDTMRLAVIAYCGARALPKTGEAIGDAVRAYIKEREASRVQPAPPT